MAYEVTATRKRPSDFNQLTGQEFVATSLQKSVASGRIAHAYLFSGPRGVGKTSAARILAKAINCEKGQADNPCGVCANCISIAKGNSLDVIEIDGASNTSVNDVRQIRDEVLFAPSNSKYKVYIIDEIHMLSNSAFNALLKTVEEPPPYIVFIFATTEIHKVPATIRSRCQQFNFRLIPLEDIKIKLAEISKETGVEAEDDALFWIAKEATGSLRDAYTLYDQIVSFSDGKITLAKIKEKLGLVGIDEMNELAENFISCDGNEALRVADSVLVNGVSPEQFVVELAEYFRNVLLIKNGVKKENVLGTAAERFSAKVVEGLSVQQAEFALSLLLDLFRSIRYSLNQKFEIELAISKLSFITRQLSGAEIVDNIKRLKDDVRRIGVVSSDNAQVSTVSGHQEEKTDFTSARDEIVTDLKKSNVLLASALSKTTVWEKTGDTIAVMCADKFSFDCVKNEAALVENKLAALEGKKYKLNVSLAEKKEEHVVEAEPIVNSQVDLVKKIFKGEIVKVIDSAQDLQKNGEANEY